MARTPTDPRGRRAASRALTTALATLLLAAAPAVQALEVFACEPEWAALVRELAPDARITSATHARQDPHHVEARPALISALRRADLAVCTGASLEVGWLPVLQQRAANARVQPGQLGLFFASDSVILEDIPATVDRSQGDIHAEGNPHFHLDPERLIAIARDLADQIALVEPAGADAVRRRYAAWEADWRQRMAGWKARAQPVAGRTVVAQHGSFLYLLRWMGLRQIADLEPKPGLPPTIGHLQRVLQAVRAEPPIAVLQTQFQDPQAGRWLTERLPVPLLVLPSTVTDDGPTATLAGLFDHLIEALVAAAAKL